jgi:hypothetical protein
MSSTEVLVLQNYSASYSVTRSAVGTLSSMMVDDEVLVVDTRSKISPAQAVDSKLVQTAHRAEEYNRGTHFIRKAGRISKVQ